MVYWNRLPYNTSVCEREKENFLEKASEHLGIIPMEYDTYLWFVIITKSVFRALEDITGCSYDRNST